MLVPVAAVVIFVGVIIFGGDRVTWGRVAFHLSLSASVAVDSCGFFKDTVGVDVYPLV